MGPQPSPAYAPVNSSASAHLTAKRHHYLVNSLFFTARTCVSAGSCFLPSRSPTPVGCRRMAPRQPLDWFTLSAVVVRRGRGAFPAALTTALLLDTASGRTRSLRCAGWRRNFSKP